MPPAREKGSSGTKLRNPQQADVGTKTRSAGRVPPGRRARRPLPETVVSGAADLEDAVPRQGRSVWRSWSRDDTVKCPTGSVTHVEEKLTRLEKYDHRIIRVDVEICKERNPRQA